MKVSAAAIVAAPSALNYTKQVPSLSGRREKDLESVYKHFFLLKFTSVFFLEFLERETLSGFSAAPHRARGAGSASGTRMVPGRKSLRRWTRNVEELFPSFVPSP